MPGPSLALGKESRDHPGKVLLFAPSPTGTLTILIGGAEMLATESQNHPAIPRKAAKPFCAIRQRFLRIAFLVRLIRTLGMVTFQVTGTESYLPRDFSFWMRPSGPSTRAKKALAILTYPGAPSKNNGLTIFCKAEFDR